jgi:hypothetical protein
MEKRGLFRRKFFYHTRKSTSAFNFNFSNENFLKSKASQITIFVIIALILVVGLGVYFVIKPGQSVKVNPQFDNVYNYYLSCIDTAGTTGASILGQQGGYIELPNFEPGSEYSPFSSQLEFLGINIPYWYYVSGNGVKREQVPTVAQMEMQLAEYIREEINTCDLSEFKNSGINITLGEPSVSTIIKSNKITVYVSQKLILSDNITTDVIENHNSEFSSNLGSLYQLSKNIYDYENQNLFLENYAKDVLYIYAPVTGTNLSCSPMIWNPYNVFDKLKRALEANVQLIKLKGNYYTLQDNKRGYFVVSPGFDLGDNQVNFMYTQDWPSKFEVWPTKGNVMMANPVGTQEGLGVMGFCYVPYKFVYDAYFPVLVQVFSKDSKEVFQFPIGVVINKNNPREPADGASEEMTETVCDKANTNISVYTYGENLEPVEAYVEFKCFNDICSLGNTKNDNSTNESSLNAAVPTCANGELIVNSQGYKEEKQIISTNEEISADVLMSKEYTLGLEVYVDNVLSNDLSVLSINEIMPDTNNSEFVNSVAYPYTKEVKLASGYYEFSLNVYKQGSLTLPEVTSKQCVNTPREGVLGLFGMEEEKCYDVIIPSQTVTNVVSAGGSTQDYFTSDMLEKAKSMKIYATSIKMPSNINELQSSYDNIQVKSIDIKIE